MATLDFEKPILELEDKINDLRQMGSKRVTLEPEIKRLESKLERYPNQLERACVELAKDWRTDRYLRRLEALLAVVNGQHTLLVTGNGDVIQPTDGVLGIGSGGNYAVAAARALVAHSELSAADIVRRSLEIAAGIDIYTNENIVVEQMPCAT